MIRKPLKINYPSLSRFLKDYSQIKTGNLFLRTQTPLPLGTEVMLTIAVPEIKQPFQAECTVSRLSGTLPHDPLKEYPGMLLSISRSSKAFTHELNRLLSHSEKKLSPSRSVRRTKKQSPGPALTKQPVKQPAPESPDIKKNGIHKESTLSMDWIKKALQRDKGEIEGKHVEEKFKFSSITEKKDLTPEERRKVSPVGEFIMDLTKAMLRSGYYSPDHPGSMKAKQGLLLS